MRKTILFLVVLQVLFSIQTTFAQTTECRNVPVLNISEVIQDRSDLDYLYDGFCLKNGNQYLFYAGYPSWEFTHLYGPAYYVTDAHYYDNELMDNKLLEEGIDLATIGAEDGIALQTCPIAEEHGLVLVGLPGIDHDILAVVVDCASPEHQEYRQSRGFTAAIDMTFRLAEKYGFTGSGGVENVTICTDLVTPEITCSGEPVSFYQWFWDNLSYES